MASLHQRHDVAEFYRIAQLRSRAMIDAYRAWGKSMDWAIFGRAVVACLLASGAAPARAQVVGEQVVGEAPAAAVYFASSAIDDPQLSPDGMRVAARAMVDGLPRLALFDATASRPSARPLALPEEERLEWHRWTGASTLLVSLLRQGDAPTSRLVSIDLGSARQTQLGAPRPAGAGDALLHVDSRGRFLLLASQRGGATPGVYRIDLSTGAVALAVAPQPHVWEWFADAAGVVRAGRALAGPRSWMVYRRDEGARFSRSRRAAGAADFEQVVPVRGSDQGYALASMPGGRTGVYRYDFRTGRLGRLAYAHHEADVDSFDSGEDGRLLGVTLGDGVGAPLWLDPALAARQQTVDLLLPGRVNRVLSDAPAGGRLLVFSESAGDPGAFYLVAGARATLLSEINPALAGRPGAAMRAIRYAARDGLDITGFLTLPAGRDSHGLPLIVMPHGGPFARDDWGYDPWVQYLAARGYAVLQPNYRGSTGRGADFVARGDGQWGRGMQDDLDDGVAWLAAAGTIDPKRVCIMGASYGGYAALWGAVRDPGRYRCAISFAGISDVAAQLAYDRKTFRDADFRIWKRRIQGRAPSLDALSPLARVRVLRTPLLLAHGTADDTVPPDQSERLHKALNALGYPHDYVAYAGEGHTLADPANDADFLERVGRFLQAHNPS
jgi:dienelactone hydrolase